MNKLITILFVSVMMILLVVMILAEDELKKTESKKIEGKEIGKQVGAKNDGDVIISGDDAKHKKNEDGTVTVTLKPGSSLSVRKPEGQTTDTGGGMYKDPADTGYNTYENIAGTVQLKDGKVVGGDFKVTKSGDKWGGPSTNIVIDGYEIDTDAGDEISIKQKDNKKRYEGDEDDKKHLEVDINKADGGTITPTDDLIKDRENSGTQIRTNVKKQEKGVGVYDQRGDKPVITIITKGTITTVDEPEEPDKTDKGDKKDDEDSVGKLKVEPKYIEPGSAVEIEPKYIEPDLSLRTKDAEEGEEISMVVDKPHELRLKTDKTIDEIKTFEEIKGPYVFTEEDPGEEKENVFTVAKDGYLIEGSGDAGEFRPSENNRFSIKPDGVYYLASVSSNLRDIDMSGTDSLGSIETPNNGFEFGDNGRVGRYLSNVVIPMGPESQGSEPSTFGVQGGPGPLMSLGKTDNYPTTNGPGLLQPLYDNTPLVPNYQGAEIGTIPGTPGKFLPLEDITINDNRENSRISISETNQGLFDIRSNSGLSEPRVQHNKKCTSCEIFLKVI
ncbi:MAG: hypothetical protein ABIH37_01910 [archaeon]